MTAAPTPGPHQSQPPTLRANRASVNGWNADYLDEQFARFRQDPSSVPADLAQFFQGFELGLASPAPVAVAAATTIASSAPGAAPAGDAAFSRRVDDLINAYRTLGHLAAKLDPLQRPRVRPSALDPAFHGLSQADLARAVAWPASLAGAGASPTLAQLIERLEATYCASTGVEFAHIPDERERAFFRERFESGAFAAPHSPADQVRILEQLTSAERFDKFLGVRYQGKKRFSAEGAESLIPLLKWLTQRCGELGVQEVIMGMAHRGRLSVLRNYLGKDLPKLFTEFEDSWTDAGNQGGGDVKYHRGYSGDQPVLPNSSPTSVPSVHLSMLNNPSHLESVNPLVMGRARAKQDYIQDAQRRKVIALLIHGDAAVMGQGVVAECLNMSKLDGYDCGGTIHVVVNNQVGFTTDWRDARSTTYCTDIAKMIDAPVLHVNADDPQAVVAAALLAADYRHQFAKDVFIDLVCFRRYGHNEQDEPNYTQPGMYALVRSHPGTAELFRRRLIAQGVLTQQAADAMADAFTSELDQAQTQAKQAPVNPVPPPGGGLWAGFRSEYTFDQPKTSVDPAIIAEVCAAMGKAPDAFNVHPKLKGLLQARAGLPTSRKLAHADAEEIAIGTLLLESFPVRLSGQDCRRGTFTQRHAVLRDEKTDERYTPLNHIRPGKQAQFSVWDSPLSEFAVMGFDYGYSRAWPQTLVMWEGQFGDFVNGAQVIIDQYLASSEVKWNRWGGLVLLLPHGYEGQGPEHSSARLERFLQLCADDNIEVVYPSTGAQTFHMLRRQALRNFRKPLVVMTPKKYLRIETSTIEELSTGAFQHLIDDPTMSSADDAKGVSSVLYCSGKLYHELHERRTAIARKDVAIVRVEQLYPFHTKLAREIDARYPAGATRMWVQEEPRNQGAYVWIADVFNHQVGVELGYIGRPASASPATGSEYAHKAQQEAILSRAIGPAKPAQGQATTANGAYDKPAGAKHGAASSA